MTYANPSEIVTEIIMSREKSPWLAVEGYSDEMLLRYRNFSRPVKVVVGHGWEGVKDILFEFSKEKSEAVLVGLIDRDYRDHCGCQINIGSLILTDMRDVENMMFNSSALTRVFSEYGSAAKLPALVDGRVDVNRIRSKVYSAAVQIGRLRIYCEHNAYGVSFRNVEHKKFMCDRTLSIDVQSLLAHVNGKNQGKRSLVMSDWTSSQSMSWTGHLGRDEFISNGHDVMAIAALALRRLWGTNGGDINGESMEGYFRVGYSDADLESSDMWNQLDHHIQS
jgi:hypothetical protein